MRIIHGAALWIFWQEARYIWLSACQPGLHQESSEGNQPVVLTLDPRREKESSSSQGTSPVSMKQTPLKTLFVIAKAKRKRSSRISTRKKDG
jgi:hypothetical protein